MIDSDVQGFDVTHNCYRYSERWRELWTRLVNVYKQGRFSAWVVASLLNEVERLEGVEKADKAKVAEQAKEIEELKQANVVLQYAWDAMTKAREEVEKVNEVVKVEQARSKSLTESRDRWEGWHRYLATKWKAEVVKTTELTKEVERRKKAWVVQWEAAESWYKAAVAADVRGVELTKKVEELEKKLAGYKSLDGLYVHNGTGRHIRVFVP